MYQALCRCIGGGGSGRECISIEPIAMRSPAGLVNVTQYRLFLFSRLHRHYPRADDASSTGDFFRVLRIGAAIKQHC